MINTVGLLAILLVTVAGGLGAVLRLFLSQWQAKLPWGILLANTLASAVLGFLLNTDTATLVVASAFAGGLSTFSSFAAQTAQFLSAGQRLRAFLNIALNFALPSTAVILGAVLASALLK
jgi:CrcB protein